MTDMSELDYDEIEELANKSNKSSNIGLFNYLNDILLSKKVGVVEKLTGMTAEELTYYYENDLQTNNAVKLYVEELSRGLDSLTFKEIRYLRMECPVFDYRKLEKYAASRRDEVTPVLQEQLKKYIEFEQKSMQWFIAALQYEVMEGLQRQFKQFAVAFSMDGNMDETTGSALYAAYMNCLRQYWNEGIIYDYILAQTKNYNESLNNAREELLKNLGIEGQKTNIIQIPAVDTSITLGLGGFNKMAAIRNDLSSTSFGAGIVSGLASFITGGFLASVGESIYMSGKNKEAARAELPHRRSYLLATYDKLSAKSDSEMKKLATHMLNQQQKQSQEFYNYVLKEY